MGFTHISMSLLFFRCGVLISFVWNERRDRICMTEMGADYRFLRELYTHCTLAIGFAKRDVKEDLCELC